MKKIIFMAFLICTFSIFAQPVFNASDINPLNISSNNFSFTSSSLSVGSSGANQTWNFANLTLTPQGTTSNNSVSIAPFASSFNNSNFYVKSVNGTNIYYGYYNLTSSKLDVLGASNDTTIFVTYTNPQTVFVFPFTFNTVMNDTFQTSSDPTVRSSSNTYDAYGTLITAFGTFNNVMRFKQVIDGSTSYNWIKVNPYQELMSASLAPNGIINFNIKQPTNLSTTQNQLNNQLSIFPNPTSGTLTIKNPTFSENETFINVYDVLGNEIIKNDKIDNNSKNIDLSDLASGLYFIKITDANNAVLYSDKIIKN